MSSILRSKTFHTWFGIAVSAALIGWVFWSVDWHLVGHEMYRLRWWAFLPSAVIFLLHYLLRAVRWRYLLPTGCAASVRELFDAIMVGALATFILPLRAGEFVRPFMVSRGGTCSFTTAFVSVVVERFFDLSVVLLTFGFVSGSVPGIPGWVHHGAYLLTGLAVAIFIVMVLGSFFPGEVLKCAEYMLSIFPHAIRHRLHTFLEDFLAGATVLSRGTVLLRVVLLSFLVWGSCYLLFYSFFWWFGEFPTIYAPVTVAVIVALAVAAPSAPGFLGVYQTACVAAFALFHMRSELAVAYSIVTHLFHYIIFVSYGTWVLFRKGLRLSELRQESEESIAPV